MSSRSNVRSVSSLSFKDGSTYSGQVLDDPKTHSSLPFGYGKLATKDGFIQCGYFHNGKARGAGIFTAPNGDTFYGEWNDHHKRNGLGLNITSSGTELIETYDDGAMLKRVKRRPLTSASSYHWIHRGLHDATGNKPSARSGHTATLTADGALMIVFGGECVVNGVTATSNDVFIYDVATNKWMQPATSGTVPPAMHGHSATMIERSLYVIGGQLAGIEVNSNVYALNLDNGQWTTPLTKGIPFSPGHSATYVPYRQSIIIIIQSSLYTLHIPTMTYAEEQIDMRSLKRTPRTFIGHSATLIDRDIYVFGGRILTGAGHNDDDKQWERCSADWRILHTDTLKWSVPAVVAPEEKESTADYSGITSGQYDTPRCDHAAVLVDGVIHIVGGQSTSNPMMNVIDNVFLSDVQRFDVRLSTWLPPVRSAVTIRPRANHSAVLISSNRILIIGGRNAAEAVLNDMPLLNVPNDPANVNPTTVVKTAVLKPVSNAIVNKSTADVLPSPTKPTPSLPNSSAPISSSMAGTGSVLDMFKVQYAQQQKQ